MAILVAVPDRIPTRVERAATELDDGPTIESPVPQFDEEDDIVPDVEEPEAADAGVQEPPVLGEAVPASASRPPARRSVVRSVRDSALLQLALLTLAGGGVIAWLFLADPPPKEVDAPIRSDAAKFPTIEIEGAEPVTEAEIARRLRAAPLSGGDRDAAMRAELKAIAELGREAVGADELDREQAAEQVDRRGRSSRRTRGSVDVTETGARPPAAKVGRWFSPGGTMKVEGLPEEESVERLPLAVGERLFARLEVGISSGHAGPVLARLMKPVSVRGAVVAPEDSVVTGAFRSDGRRVYVVFSELILPDGGRLAFDGFAVDGKVPGLVATRRVISPDEGSGVFEESVDVAKEVVRSVASGSIVGRVAQGVVDGALPEPEQKANSGVILEVEAGTRFQIVISGGAK